VLQHETEDAGNLTGKIRTEHQTQVKSKTSSKRNVLPSGLQPLERLVCEVIRPGAGIRSWFNHRASGYIVLDLDKNRYCENIQREHKGNHILIVVDVTTGLWWQKCQDPECREIDFRSPKRELPDDVLAAADNWMLNCTKFQENEAIESSDMEWS